MFLTEVYERIFERITKEDLGLLIQTIELNNFRNV
jgi:hypothetical protein